jgi:hypothetical protein
MTEDLQYPIGKFKRHADPLGAAERQALIDGIAATPLKVRKAITNLSVAQFDLPYRPGGWTARQVVHHLADSHLNAYTRFRLALTEDEPTIKPYNEAAWAELSDAKTAPVEVSLVLLEKIHERWTLLMRALAPEAFARTFKHPDLGAMSLDVQLQLYEWHGRHHLAHLALCKQ